MLTEILNIVDLLGYPTVVIVTVGPAYCCYCYTPTRAHTGPKSTVSSHVQTQLDMSRHGWTRMHARYCGPWALLLAYCC